MSETPSVPADPVAAEDTYYAAIVSEYGALRKAGAGLLAAAALTAAHMVYLAKAGDD